MHAVRESDACAVLQGSPDEAADFVHGVICLGRDGEAAFSDDLRRCIEACARWATGAEPSAALTGAMLAGAVLL